MTQPIDKQPDFILGVGNPNADTKATFEVAANGYLWEHEQSAEASDTFHSDFEASGEVWGGWDFIAVRGYLTDFALDGQAQVTINGQNVSANNVTDYRPERFTNGTGNGSSGGSSDGDSTESSPADTSDSSGGTDTDASGAWNPGSGSSDRDLDAKHGVVDRPFVTNKDKIVTVGSGGDCGTVQEALNRIPRFVEHKFWIQLEQGVHGNEPGDSLNFPPSIVAAAHGSIKIVGDAENPRDYAIDIRQGNPMFVAGTAQNVSFEGVHIRGSLQNRFGMVEIDSCVVSAGQRWGKGDSVALDTYGGHIQVLDSTLESDEAAVNLVESASVSFDADSIIDADGPLVTSGQSGGEVCFSGKTSVSCNGRLTDENWDQSLVIFKDTHNATKGLKNGSSAVVLG